MISRPTAPDPVKAIVATRGSATSRAPSSPSPGRRLSAPAGTPAPRSASTIASEQPGDCSAGLRHTGLPAASAPAVIPVAIANGKFHGAMTAVTPRGRHRSVLRSPAGAGSEPPDWSPTAASA